MRKKSKGFTKKKSIVLTRIKTSPKRGGVKLFKGLFTRKKNPSPSFFPVVPDSKSISNSKSISKSRSKSKSKSKSKSVKDETIFKIQKKDIMFLDDTDDIYKLKLEINRLNTLNAELTHQIFNLTDKINQIETSMEDVGVCQTISNKIENKRLNKILENLKNNIINDIKTKLEKNPNLKGLIMDNLSELLQTKNFISQSPRITSLLQKQAAEKLPRLILSFVSSKIAQKVSLACSSADNYLTTEEIENIGNFIVEELKIKK